MRALIVGEGKSGTTALLRSISAVLDDPVEVFEPVELRESDLDPESLVVKKLLLNWKRAERKLLDRFDKRVLIVRDPRDRLISHLLYDAYNKAEFLDAEQREKWLYLLLRKTRNPNGISLMHLMNAWWRMSRTDLVSHHVRATDRSRVFQRRFGDQFFVLKYEDYVDGSFDAINDYLGVELSPGEVKGSEARVVRSGTYGEWRDWLTPADVEVLRPMTHNWLKNAGYDFRDWDLTEPDALDPATTVEYVESLFARKPLEPDSSGKPNL